MRVKDEIKPRKWQVEALARWQEGLRGVVHIVTGGGKTIFSYLCIEQFADRYPKGRVVIVVPTISLMDQWTVDITDSMDLGGASVKCFAGGEKPECPGKINIVVVNTARSLIGWLCQGADTMLVVDECHRVGTKQNARGIEGEFVASLGLSATPYREFDDGFEQFIGPMLGDVIYEYDYPSAYHDGVIVDFKLINVDIKLDQQEFEELNGNTVISVAKGTTQYKEVGGGEKFTKALIKASRAAWAVKICLRHSSERVVVFHERVGSLISIVRMLRAYGLSCVEYHSRLSAAHRRDNLRIFRRGEANVLVTCRALDEGTNIPESNVAIVAQSTISTRQRIQRLGRVLRPAQGKRYAAVYTLYASEEERNRLEDEERDLEGVAGTYWKSGSLQ